MPHRTLTTISHHCEIIIAGHLSPKFLPWEEHEGIQHLPNGTTVIQLLLIDQAALFGTLDRIRDLGCPLISLRVDPPKIKFKSNLALHD
jgi:hypothetical protein